MMMCKGCIPEIRYCVGKMKIPTHLPFSADAGRPLISFRFVSSRRSPYLIIDQWMQLQQSSISIIMSCQPECVMNGWSWIFSFMLLSKLASWIDMWHDMTIKGLATFRSDGMRIKMELNVPWIQMTISYFPDYGLKSQNNWHKSRREMVVWLFKVYDNFIIDS